MVLKKIFCIIQTLFFIACSTPPKPSWQHLSTTNGNFELPMPGSQQTACAVFDIDNDGINDFVIAERTQAPSIVWYRYTKDGWQRYILDDSPLRIEAGSAICDIDNDGDIDLVMAGDSGSNQVWWWENPFPAHDPQIPWNRHIIKNTGVTKHHDQIFGDFDNDGVSELVFWNQNASTLFLAEIPADPQTDREWPTFAIYTYDDDKAPQQRGSYPNWKSPYEHEGLAKADIDGDGIEDIIGGGRWFKHIEGNIYKPNVIDSSYTFSRCAAGQLIKGGRPEVVMVVGDGHAPLLLYEWKKEQWMEHVLIDSVHNGHSLDLIDVNQDGDLDIFNAEMQLNGYSNAKIRILLGDGKGHFRETFVDSGYGLHESRIADLDGDGDPDILGKPYNWQTPRLDIWINTMK